MAQLRKLSEIERSKRSRTQESLKIGMYQDELVVRRCTRG